MGNLGQPHGLPRTHSLNPALMFPGYFASYGHRSEVLCEMVIPAWEIPTNADLQYFRDSGQRVFSPHRQWEYKKLQGHQSYYYNPGEFVAGSRGGVNMGLHSPRWDHGI